MINDEFNLVSQLDKNEQNSTSSSLLQFDNGSKANDINNEKVNDDSFIFVQQDKKLHDQSFTTKPTTFFKDALRRFSKNKSSVVGGIILLILFLLALIVPFANTFDTKQQHGYETNLPMKLFPVGEDASGFWDGTRTLKNQQIPYEFKINSDGDVEIDENKFNGTFDDNNAVCGIKNVSKGYIDSPSNGGTGGYIRIEKTATHDEASKASTYMYHYKYAFDFANIDDYKIEFELGSRKQDGYLERPNFSIILNCESQNKTIELTQPSNDYGSEEKKINNDSTINPHTKLTYSLNDLVKNVDPSILKKECSIGLKLYSDKDLNTALYVKSFVISSNKESVSKRAQLLLRSFGTEQCKIKDANTLALQTKDINGKPNVSYWTNVLSEVGLDCADVLSLKCDILVDVYQQHYGLRSDMEIAGSTFQKWIDEGLIEYDFSKGAVKDNYKIKSKDGVYDKSTDVYVTSVQKQSDTDVTNSDGTLSKIYTLNCTVLMYKYLGYKSMPYHLFGTDSQGRDLFKYVFSGLRTSLILGFVVAFINIAIGVLWGSFSGYMGGATDLILERVTDVLSGIPTIVLMTVLTIKLGPTFFVFALSLCLTGWIGTASTTREQFYRYRDREYVLACKTLGARSPRIIFRHILPNAIGTIITSSILMIPSVIFSEATLSYLGLGLKNLDSLGVILSKNQAQLQYYPSQLVFPAVIISLLMICFNLFGNGLRDAFNPSLKGADE